MTAAAMIEQEIHAQAGGHRLAGTLCLPDATGPFPVVLMVHGSGPLDRDQNMKGQKLDIFNTIARHLASHGIASVRFDKRGCGASQGDYHAAGHHDFVDDVVCWYDLIRLLESCRAGQVFLLGHSEGCLAASHALGRRPTAAGLVLLCPFVEPMEDILVRQARQIEREMAARRGLGRIVGAFVTLLFGSPVANQQALIRRLRTSTEASIRVGFERVPAKWLRELLSVDASQVFARLTCPMLLVGGEKDLQCNPADVARIAAIAPGPVEAHVLGGMTHVLRRDDDAPTLFGTRRLLARPVESELLALVTAWVRARSAA